MCRMFLNSSEGQPRRARARRMENGGGVASTTGDVRSGAPLFITCRILVLLPRRLEPPRRRELAVVDVVGAVRALDAPVVRESKAIGRSVVVLPEVRLNERRPVRRQRFSLVVARESIHARERHEQLPALEVLEVRLAVRGFRQMWSVTCAHARCACESRRSSRVAESDTRRCALPGCIFPSRVVRAYRQRSSGHIMHGLTGTDAAPVVGSSRMISQ